MTREEHLLVILTEECAEVIKETSKALRFGLDDHKPGQYKTNRERITAELNDLFAVIAMLVDDETFKSKELAEIEFMEAKRRKVEYYLKYSKYIGK